jgi:hypothetical protein
VYLQENGFDVTERNTSQLGQVKQRLGVPPRLGSCHTAEVGGYIVEGHVPADVIKRMLDEKPSIVGIAVPGMPVGSPGMEVPGVAAQPYEVIAWTKDGTTSVYDRR